MNVFIWAPAEYWRLTHDERKNFRCGPGRGILEMLVPETIWGLCVTPACAVHDFMYREGPATDDGKEEADLVFLNNMVRIIEAHTKNRWLLCLRLRRARLYYEMVRRFGGPAYWITKNLPNQMGLVSSAAH